MEEQSIKLYRIWSGDSNDRSEIARIKAKNFETVQDFLLQEFIKPEFRDQIEKTEFGLEWNTRTPEECFEDLSEEEQSKISIDDVCMCCDGCTTYLQIEEIEKPDSKSFEFKTIWGTNEYYDLTGEKPVKAEDWHPTLAIIAKSGDMQKLSEALTKEALEFQKKIRKEVTEKK